MLLDKLGYVISEIPPLLFLIWFAVKFIQFRRRQRQQPVFSDADRELLFGGAKRRPAGAIFYVKLGLAATAVATVGFIEILVLAPLGAAILTGVLLLTSTAIVHQLLASDA